MAEPRFVKAPAFRGKELTLYVGGGDKKIQDNVVYRGGKFAKFVGMGFLVPAPPEAQEKKSAPKSAPKKPVPKPAPKAKAKPEPEKVPESAAAAPAEEKAPEAASAEAAPAEGGVTKSPETPAPTPKRRGRGRSRK